MPKLLTPKNVIIFIAICVAIGLTVFFIVKREHFGDDLQCPKKPQLPKDVTKKCCPCIQQNKPGDKPDANKCQQLTSQFGGDWECTTMDGFPIPICRNLTPPPFC